MTLASFPAEASALLARIEAAARARSVRAYAVGGSVRDALLGRPMRDLDMAVEGDALGFARALAAEIGGHFVELDDVQAIARVVTDGPIKHIDVAKLQGTLEEDLRRRDFTIDAMAAPLVGGEVADVTGGLADLRDGVVRMTTEAALEADPLRLLRGVRIACELGFRIEERTREAIARRAPAVLQAAAERRRDELALILALPSTEPALRLLNDTGLLDALLPEVTFGRGVTQPKEHAYDVLEHALHTVGAVDELIAAIDGEAAQGALSAAVRNAFAWCREELRAYLRDEMREGRPRTVALRLSALLHDIAKPQTRTVDVDGRARFFGHADEGATMAGRIMRRLRFSSREVRFVTRLVAEHLRPVQLAAVGEVPTRRALYRFYRDLGDAVPAVVLLALADAAAARGPALSPEGWTRQVLYMNSLLVRSREEEGIVQPPRLLSGNDVMAALGLPEGPRIGAILAALREAQAAGEVTDRRGAIEYVKQLARGGEA